MLVPKIASDLDIKFCRSYNIGFVDVYGSMFDSVFTTLDFKPIITQQLRNLVMLRIAAPASKLRTMQLSSEYGMDCKVDSIYKLMDRLTTPVIDKIKKIVYEHSTQLVAKEKTTIDSGMLTNLLVRICKTLQNCAAWSYRTYAGSFLRRVAARLLFRSRQARCQRLVLGGQTTPVELCDDTCKTSANIGLSVFGNNSGDANGKHWPPPMFQL